MPELRGAGLWPRVAFDGALILILAALCVGVRRLPRDSRWRAGYVGASVVVMLLGMDAWYFQSLHGFGQNSDYVLGVITLSALVVLPPWLMAGVLAANHLAFMAVFLASNYPQQIKITGTADNTAAVVLGWLVASVLYRSRKAEFLKARALEEANAELNEVMAITAHDLRSPLLGVRDLLALGRKEPQVTEGGVLARILDQAGKTCEGLVRLVSRLVDAHAAETARPDLVAQDLRPVCTDVVEKLRPTAEAKEQPICVSLPDRPALAEIDRDTLAQVLENLIGNALKFSRRGATIECLLAVSDRICRIEVRDEGPGVPEEEQALLFGKFHRGSVRPTGGEASTGLGLFIVREFVESMNGTVGYAPREGGGSVFAVELPCVR